MRKVNFASGEFYHIYNRGVDGRDIFIDQTGFIRFIKSINEFNDLEPVGSIYENSFTKSKKKKRLVNIVCYALNPNHFHFILEQLEDRGIEKFMHRLGTGYTMFFNKRHKRSGSLFQGTFKAIHVENNEYLLHLSIYVNLNDKIHQLGGLASKLSQTSFNSYVGKLNPKLDKILGDISIIKDQFKNAKEYKKFAEEILPDIIERKQLLKELETLMIEEE